MRLSLHCGDCYFRLSYRHQYRAVTQSLFSELIELLGPRGRRIEVRPSEFLFFLGGGGVGK